MLGQRSELSLVNVRNLQFKSRFGRVEIEDLGNSKCPDARFWIQQWPHRSANRVCRHQCSTSMIAIVVSIKLAAGIESENYIRAAVPNERNELAADLKLRREI